MYTERDEDLAHAVEVMLSGLPDRFYDPGATRVALRLEVRPIGDGVAERPVMEIPPHVVSTITESIG